MTRLRKRWAIPVAALAGLLVATVPVMRDQLLPSHHQGPWIFGRADARWTITEFADLECPFCKTYTPALKAWVLQQDDVNLQWHHLPLDFHGQPARHEARLVECAGVIGGTDAFWKTVDQVFQRTQSNGQGFSGYLELTGIETQDLVHCAISNLEVAMRIDQQLREAQDKGISATPTLLITDNTSRRSIKLEGPADGTTLLSAIDWLSQPTGDGAPSK
jgi:protein-disulfide isomerase